MTRHNQHPRRESMQLKDVMNPDVEVIEADATMQEVAQ
jgi:hypothetical protein